MRQIKTLVYLLIILIPIIFIKPSFAQIGNQHALNVGIRAGYVNSTIYGSEIDFRNSNNGPVTPREGFDASISFQYQVYKFIHLFSGVGITQRGGSIEPNGMVYPIDVSLNYLYVPLTLGLNPINLKGLSVLVDGGIVFNYEISSEQDFKKGYSTQPMKARKHIPSTTYGVIVQYKVSEKLAAQFDAHWLKELKPFFEEDLIPQEPPLEIKTKGTIYSIGLVYKLKH